MLVKYIWRHLRYICISEIFPSILPTWSFESPPPRGVFPRIKLVRKGFYDQVGNIFENVSINKISYDQVCKIVGNVLKKYILWRDLGKNLTHNSRNNYCGCLSEACNRRVRTRGTILKFRKWFRVPGVGVGLRRIWDAVPNIRVICEYIHDNGRCIPDVYEKRDVEYANMCSKNMVNETWDMAQLRHLCRPAILIIGLSDNTYGPVFISCSCFIVYAYTTSKSKY